MTPSLCYPVGFTQPPSLLQTFLVRRDGGSKHLVLCVHFPSRNGSSSEVLEYTIREEKSSEYPPFCSASDHSSRCCTPNHRAPPSQSGGVQN